MKSKLLSICEKLDIKTNTMNATKNFPCTNMH